MSSLRTLAIVLIFSSAAAVPLGCTPPTSQSDDDTPDPGDDAGARDAFATDSAASDAAASDPRAVDISRETDGRPVADSRGADGRVPDTAAPPDSSDGSSCPVGGCDAGPTAACCLPSSGCTDTTRAGCRTKGGEYRSGVTCAQTRCSIQRRGCCSRGSCTLKTPRHCYADGGIPDWSASSCSAANCQKTPCCSGRSCSLAYRNACVGSGGVPRAAASCSKANCTLSSCCVYGECYEQVPPSTCRKAGGTPHRGTPCSGVSSCSPVQSSCCLNGRFCMAATKTQCEDFASNTTFQKNQSCSASGCITGGTRGACCIPSFLPCTMTTRRTCAQVGGRFHAGSSCQNTRCY